MFRSVFSIEEGGHRRGRGGGRSKYIKHDDQGKIIIVDPLYVFYVFCLIEIS